MNIYCFKLKQSLLSKMNFMKIPVQIFNSHANWSNSPANWKTKNSFPISMRIRPISMLIGKKLALFAELHADNWSWRKVASTDVQLWLSTYWQPLTISNLIFSPNYVPVWPTWSIFSFKNKMGSEHNLCWISVKCKNWTKIARGIIFFQWKLRFYTFQICKWEDRWGTWGSSTLYFVKRT